MSRKDLARILGRALVDHEYTDLLSSDPDRAITLLGAKLTANERAALEDISPSNLRTAADILRPNVEENAPARVDQPGSAQATPVIADERELAENPSQQEEETMAGRETTVTHTRLKALEDRLAVFDQQQQHGAAVAAGDPLVAARIKALEDRLAFFDQQQQHGAGLGAVDATVAARMKALEDRLAFFDQQQQHGSALGAVDTHVTTRLNALERRLAIFDQQQQGGSR